MTPPARALIVVPTYNEALNITTILSRLFTGVCLSPERQIHVLVVDDNSPDGTAERVARFAADSDPDGQRLFLLKRPGKDGLGRAYVAGLKWGLERGYDVLIEMDADLSHDPDSLTSILDQIDECDFVVGSRYVSGGSIRGWGPLRRLLSFGGCLYARLFLGSSIRDLTGGFNAWRAQTLRKIGLDSVISNGYVFQIEMKYRALRARLCYREIPITFREREWGKSKMTLSIALEALRGVLVLRRIVP